MAINPDSPNYHPLVRRVARALRQRCGVKPGSTVVVGCSGGADSVALVRALALLAGRRRWRLKLVVAHVQHHLRGEDAEADAAFVARLAGELGLGYERRDIQPGERPGNLEAAARTQRYRALADIALKRGASYVATAHHADDQLETLLMRLIRGASTKGLRGIVWRRRLRTADEDARVYAIRPMLEVERDQVLDLLNTLGQTWREDATNADTSRDRARLRHEVIPIIKAMRGDVAGKAVALGEQFGHLHRLVEERVEEETTGQPLDTIDRERARSLNPIVLTQMLRRDLIHAGVPADRVPGHALHPVIEAVRDSAGGVRLFEFAEGIRIEVGVKSVRVIGLV